jgi:VWFA-related protein
MRAKGIAAVLAVFLVVSTGAASRQSPAPAPTQTPVFRAGANYVRVDAYPTLDGKIIRGLMKDDFEIFEDGKVQTVALAEFVTFDAPDEARGSMLSAREGLELAADPHNRVVVFVIDRAAFDLPMWRTLREDLHDFLERQVGPRDLVGLITTDRPWTDLVLGRRVASVEEEIDAPEWLHADAQEQTAVLQGCGLEPLQHRIRADETYALLEGIIRVLGQVRDDRTSLVFLSNGLSRATPDRRWSQQKKIAVPPKIGLVNGRIQRIPRASAMHDTLCEVEGHRLADTDFDRRFSELVASARAANVAFYPVAIPLMVPLMPGGRGALGAGRGASIFPIIRVNRLPETLMDLAAGTNGYLVAGGGDVRAGLERVVSDAGPHYLLGYYTTNGKRDGKVRSIKVQLKKNGAVIQARRFYRGPTKEDVAGLSAAKDGGPVGPPPPVAAALGALSRLRTSTQFFTYGAVAGRDLTVIIEVPAAAVEAGRWKDGAALEVLAETAAGDIVGTSRARLTPNGRAVVRVPLEGLDAPAAVFVRLRAEGESVVERTSVVAPSPSSLIGDPQAYRSGPRGLAIPVALFEFTRDERLKLDWPALAKFDRAEIRLLDRHGQPLKHRVSVADQDGAGGRHLVANLSFTALGRGDYVVELAAIAGTVTDRKLTAFRVK